jgi:hypothetical protein
MESAGRAVARSVVERFGSAAGQGILVAVGPGNNGGDGWVAARALHLGGWGVWVAECGTPPEGIAAEARTMALADGVRAVDASGPWPAVGLVIDALLGTGARGAPREPMARLIARLAESHHWRRSRRIACGAHRHLRWSAPWPPAGARRLRRFAGRGNRVACSPAGVAAPGCPVMGCRSPSPTGGGRAQGDSWPGRDRGGGRRDDWRGPARRPCGVRGRCRAGASGGA